MRPRVELGSAQPIASPKDHKWRDSCTKKEAMPAQYQGSAIIEDAGVTVDAVTEVRREAAPAEDGSLAERDP